MHPPRQGKLSCSSQTRPDLVEPDREGAVLDHRGGELVLVLAVDHLPAAHEDLLARLLRAALAVAAGVGVILLGLLPEAVLLQVPAGGSYA